MTAVAAAAAKVEAPATRSRLGVRIVYSAPDLVASALAGFALPAMVLLLAGRFSPGWVLPAGIAGAALAVAVCGAGPEHVDRQALRYTLIAIGLAFGWCLINSFFSAENLFAHRDPATYNLTGRWLMDHSQLRIPSQAEIFGSPAGGTGESAGFGVNGPDHLYAQGNHLLPALLAVSGWLFGIAGLLKANVTFGALALLTFFGLARRVVDAPLALVAMVAFAVSMPLIFVSRDTYSEPLALLFLIGGLGLLHRAVTSGLLRDFALAGFVLGSSAMARIDSGVSMLAVLLTAAIFAILARRTARRRAVLSACALVGGTVVPILVGWLDVAHLSYGYYRDERHHILPIFYAGYALLVLLPLVVWASWHPAVRRMLRSPQLPRRATIAAAVLIGGGVAFLASRPLWMVAHGRNNAFVGELQRQAGDAVDGTRTYDEWTVHWLAQYLGWPLVILGVIGYILLVRQGIRTRSLATAGTIIVGLAMSLLYLRASTITPDQPWAMRRYVPVVLPILIIAAAYSICVLLRQSAALVRAAAVLLAGAMIAIPAAVTAPMAGAREEVPQLAQVQRICAAVGTRGAVLAVDQSAQTSYSQTIRSYCSVPSYALVDAQPGQLGKVRAAVAAHQRVLYVLSTDPTKIHFAGSPPDAPFSEVTTTRWPSVLSGPPTAVDHERVAVYLATVRADGLAEAVTASR
jgi:hypothetical protein